MLKKERQIYILHRLNLHNKIVSGDLCNDMGVSEDTIRRDIQELSEAGKLIKVHGGALSTAFNEVQLNPVSVYSRENKKVIAEKGISLIKEGMFILTSGGTTILELIRSLPLHLKVTFITGSIPVINACLSYPNISIIVIGDKLSHDSKLTVGPEAIEKIGRINADLCFLGTNAIDVPHGITDNDWEVVQVKKAMVNSASKLVCMCIAEKLQTFQPIQICELTKIDYLITELKPDHHRVQPFIKSGIEVL